MEILNEYMKFLILFFICFYCFFCHYWLDSFCTIPKPLDKPAPELHHQEQIPLRTYQEEKPLVLIPKDLHLPIKSRLDILFAWLLKAGITYIYGNIETSLAKIIIGTTTILLSSWFNPIFYYTMGL